MIVEWSWKWMQNKYRDTVQHWLLIYILGSHFCSNRLEDKKSQMFGSTVGVLAPSSTWIKMKWLNLEFWGVSMIGRENEGHTLHFPCVMSIPGKSWPHQLCPGVISISKKTVKVLCQFPRKVGPSNCMLRAAAARVTVYNWADLDTLSQHHPLSEKKIFNSVRRKDFLSYLHVLYLLSLTRKTK